MSASNSAKSAREALSSLYAGESKPWLVLGKGPSLNKLAQIDTSGYNLAGLNHIVASHKLNLAHIVDLEVIDQIADAIYENCKHLVMPWFPHVKFRAGSKNLDELANNNQLLGKLRAEERLLYYDLGTAKSKNEELDPIEVRFFSSEALLALLGNCGFREIRTIGIDGGSKYAAAFDNLSDKVRLANGVASFDAQFIQFPHIINRYNLDLGPVDQECPVPIFVGASENEWLSTRVLEYSIKKHSSISIDLIPLNTVNRNFSLPVKPESRPRTPFSFHRLLIPELKNYQGRAIYLDSDMLVLKDIRKLWITDNSDDNMSVTSADIHCARAKTEQQKNSRFSVMVLNCVKLKWKIEDIVESLDKGEISYEELMHQMAIADDIRDSIPPEWNTLDSYERGLTGLIHFTNMSTQPWLKAGHPCGDIWIKYLREAIDDGFITREELQTQVDLEHVRPGLLEELGYGTKLDDSSFVPPHMRSQSQDEPGSGTQKTEQRISLKDRIAGFFSK